MKKILKNNIMGNTTKGFVIMGMLCVFVCSLFWWSISLQQKNLENHWEIVSSKPVFDKKESPKVPSRIEQVALDENEKIVTVIVVDTITGKVFERKNYN